MKLPRYFTLLLFTILLLAGCTKKLDPSLNSQCDPSHYEKTPCGACIVNECKKICDACTFNEPICQACWRCIADKSCGIDERSERSEPSDDFSRYQSKDSKHRFYGRSMTVKVPSTQGQHVTR